MDCDLCPRLNAYIAANREQEPDWFNGPVPSFGSENAKLLIVGLAPGIKGANRTGRPFTGDYAGDLLYATLHDYGFANDRFDARPDDGLILKDCMVTNGVRCVPPGNKPVGAEINNCRAFLVSRLTSLPNLKAILVLGRIAHDTTLRGLDLRLRDFPFSHGACHSVIVETQIKPGAVDKRPVCLFDSYHCSRYNTNTRRLTTDMFQSVFRSIREHIDKGA